MKSAVFNTIIEDQLNVCREILIEKAKQYANDNDRLHNFRVAARKRNCTLAQAADGMDMKHVVSIDDIINNGLPKHIKSKADRLSYIEEKFTDHINYMLLKKACLLEQYDIA